MKVINLRLEGDLYEKVKELSTRERRSINNTILFALDEYLINRGIKGSEVAAEIAPENNPISPPSSEPKPVKVDSKPTSNGAQMSTEQKPSSTSAAVPAWKQRVLDKQAAKQYTKLEQKPPVIDKQGPQYTPPPEPIISEEPIQLEDII